MFTGLIAALGDVQEIRGDDAGARIAVRTPLAADIARGDSVAVNGVCLTATGLAGDGGGFEADVMHETLARTSLGALDAGSQVNLELALRASDRLGGHVVQGHVDGVGVIEVVSEDGFARVVTIGAPVEILRYVTPKGSIAVDGVSLTVADLQRSSFSVSLIPETLARTTLGAARPGIPVNLEVDVIAKYVERLVETKHSPSLSA
ncbi:MAG: riboflavin synthase [Solirubrobacteraceae bacterium]|nr:MAG: riboflavin synthase [Solirubrobacterales bacterium]